MIWALVPSFFLWNITGDTLVYQQSDQCATITGQATADDKEKDQHLTADQLKAKMQQEDLGETKADEKDKKPKAGEVWADGNVRFTNKDFDVKADHAYFHPTTNKVELKGNVRIQHKQNTAVGSEAEIDLDKQTYTLSKASGQVKDAADIKIPQKPKLRG